MPERIVIDSGPLIALARAQMLDVVGALPFRFICPAAVRAELEAGAAAGHVAVRPEWLPFAPLRGAVGAVTAALLDEGEAAVIQLALDEGIGTVCIDERAGRRIAVAVGLRVVGALGLLLRAKRVGLLATVRSPMERLQASGAWYDAELIRRVLMAAGEE